MKVLNFVSPEKSDLKFEIVSFSDGHKHLKLEHPRGLIDRVEIRTKLASADDVFLALQARDILDRWGVPYVNLFVTYLLAARMDRVMSIGEAFDLKIVLKMLGYDGDKNWQNYANVFDPHSYSNLHSFEVIDQVDFIDAVLSELGKNIHNLYFCAPDKGATRKVKSLAKHFEQNFIQALKDRDPKDGKLAPPTLEFEGDLNGAPVMIIDDICDGGRTFTNLIPVLKTKGAGDIYLAVSHGIFSQGLLPLADFKQIFTTNSYTARKSSENLTVLEMF